MIEIKEERWSNFWPDCLPLLKEHNDEIGELNQNMPLDPDIDTIAALDKAGIVQIVTAREDAAMIGYCTFTLGNSLMSRKILCGTQSIYFVKESKRNTDTWMRLYNESIKLMKAKGVKNIYPHHWLRGDSPRLGVFFRRKGAIPIQSEYSLWIGE